LEWHGHPARVSSGRGRDARATKSPAPPLNQILHNIWHDLVGASLLDQVNAVLGIVGVWLMVRRSLWAFPIGMVAVTVQGILFYRIHFPADALLQIFYFGSLAWGWRHWVRDRGAAPELPITKLSVRGWMVVLIGGTAATAGWALTVGPWMKAAMPWRDAFIAVFAVAAQVLQVRKQIENWMLWAVVNVVSIASYWSADAAYTAFLYIVIFVLGLVGWREWWRTLQAQRAGPMGNAEATHG
jgi:nicotinamide mononucleotide transporter